VLPGRSGFDLARTLRDEPGSCRPPILFVTAEGQMSSRLEAALAGGDGYLVKPVQPAFLLSTVADRLDRGSRVALLLEYDAQTRLLTPRAFLDRARGAVERKRQDPRRRGCWALIALDGMPSINSLHGAAAGDDVLARTATLLRRNLVPGESAGRYLGATFSLLLDDLRPKQALARIELLRQQLAQTEFRSAAGRFRVTVSTGLAELAPGMTVESWEEAAAQALESAKAAGDSRIEIAR
jgi:diguanylate cyclase (GGDEF)-like protein